jgi:glycosyltransferase involved in cell wall biosynthesis
MKLEKGKITVVTATYNREKYIRRVYNSLKAQTYKKFEWIVIDDGSEDNTGKLVEHWKQESEFPIQYYYQVNQGKHIAVNKAIELADGEYYTVIDSDDEIRKDSFEILINEWNKIPKNDRKKYKSVTGKML